VSSILGCPASSIIRAAFAKDRRPRQSGISGRAPGVAGDLVIVRRTTEPGARFAERGEEPFDAIEVHPRFRHVPTQELVYECELLGGRHSIVDELAGFRRNCASESDSVRPLATTIVLAANGPSSFESHWRCRARNRAD
jgi:hypothetical protein